MDVSVHSFLRMLHMAESRMTNGGTCLTVSFLGANRVVQTYNMMGPVKAALECAMRYAAAELGEKRYSCARPFARTHSNKGRIRHR
ncbi:SDR family oxidoreductase [Pseudomonas aeruginosa]|nr:SDR family oxidoreductase [Pseudomonas aeruginosa]